MLQRGLEKEMYTWASQLNVCERTRSAQGRLIVRYCVSQDSRETAIWSTYEKIYHKILVYVIMEAEKSHGLQAAESGKLVE